MFLTGRRGDLLAIIAGALLVLAYAPFNLYPLAVLCVALLFGLWLRVDARRAAWRGWLFGLGQFGAGVSWLYVALHQFGGMAPPLAVVAVLGLVAYLALFPALAGWLAVRFTATAGPAPLLVVAAPALWVLLEWLRGWFLTGFPWLGLGDTQVNSPLAGLAPWLGGYGMSLVVAVSAGLVAMTVHDRRRALTRFLPVLGGLWLVAWLLGLVSFTAPSGAPLRVALVQGNVALAEKWQPQHRGRIVQEYFDSSLKLRDVDLVIWPEAAVPAYLDQIENGFVDLLGRAAAERNMDILFGVIERDEGRYGGIYYNSAIAVGKTRGSYRKHHLVPFGEFLPFADLTYWLLDYLHIPMSAFSRGPTAQAPLALAGQQVGVSICYEDAFGYEVRRALPEATVLVNISEDAWYGDSLAPHQHQQMARLRARETGRPMLRATNTGITAIIDDHGRELARLPQFQAGVLRGSVQPMRGLTPYARFGDASVMILAGLMLAGLAVWRRRAPKS